MLLQIAFYTQKMGPKLQKQLTARSRSAAQQRDFSKSYRKYTFIAGGVAVVVLGIALIAAFFSKTPSVPQAGEKQSIGSIYKVLN